MLKNMMAVLVVSVFASGLSAQTPLLVDDFQNFDGDVWSASLPGVDTRVALNVFDNKMELELTNGAVVATRQSFDKNLFVQISWAYESDNADADRPETLTLAVRSTGKVKNGVLQDGVAIHLQTKTGEISIVEYVEGKATVLKKKTVTVRESGSAIPRGEGVNWYRLTVRDTGKTVSIQSGELSDLVLEAEYQPAKHKENRLVLFNAPRPSMDANRSFFRNLIVKSNE